MLSEYFSSFNWVILPIFLIIGLILIIIRPYAAFLLAVFLSLAMSGKTMLYTRTEELGAFFNFYDACLLISIFACISDVFLGHRSLKFPKMALGLIAVLTIGFLTTGFSSLGFTYGLLQAFRWGITIPLLFIITANLVYDEKRVKSLLLVLIVATVCAEAQHFFMASKAVVEDMAAPEALRSNLLFDFATPEVWLLAGPFLVAGRIPRLWLQLAVGTLLLAGLAIGQARSSTLAFVLALGVCHLWLFKGPHGFRLKRILPLIIIGFACLGLLTVFKMSSLPGGTFSKIDRSLGKDDTEGTMEPRKNDFYVEGRDYLDGNFYNLLFGRGLSYFGIYYKSPSMARKLPQKIGFGHLAYITYLSQLGLFGFLIYGIFFPASAILAAKRLFEKSEQSPVIIYLAALTGAFFIDRCFLGLFSSGFLLTQIYPGILAGTMWRISSAYAAEELVDKSVTSPMVTSPSYKIVKS